MIAVVFDLDNTLYDTKQYFLGAFNKIAEYLSKKYQIPKQKVYKKLVSIWEEKTSMYPHLFDDLLSFLDLEKELENVIKIFNEYSGKLKPYFDVISTLRELRNKNFKLGIITDGNVKRQKRKIKLLRIADFFDVIIFTKEFGSPKPSHTPFLKTLEELSVGQQNSFYVGDNPLVDFEGAKKVGMRTVRILRSEFKNVPSNKYVDFEIEDFNKLIEIVKI